MKKQHELKTTTITDILTADEIKQCVKLYARATPGTFAKLCDEQIIQPILPRIEGKLGQQMHSRYVAYMVEYVLRRSAE